MNEATDTLEISRLAERAKRLSPADRRMLIDELVISLDGEPDADPKAIEAAWDAEIARRVASADRGEVEWVAGDKVLADLRARLAPQR
jgi:putative addiction module component (TIGR02574 family)